MRSFTDIERTFAGQPPALGPLLSRIDIGKGREQLFHDQAPELLVALAEQTRIASIKASNAIEGVIVESERAERLAVSDSSRFRNRNEREFAGYRDAIDELMRAERHEDPTVPFVLHLHRRLFRHVDGRGGCLKTDQNLIVSFEEGRRQVIFKPPPPGQTEFLLTELTDRYGQACRDQAGHPLLLLAAFILDFLAIHPVADGNGRLARLLTTQQLLAHGYGVARYVSLEQRIFESKNSYYAALQASQRDWHQGDHSIWPWTEYLVRILADAYDAFERRAAAAVEQAGTSKQQTVRGWIVDQAPPTFRLRDIRGALPGISDATIRIVLQELKREGKVRPMGHGRGAAWEKPGSPPAADT